MYPEKPHTVLKQLLARELCAMLHDWSLTEAATRLASHPTRISKLRAGRLRDFSIQCLLNWILMLGHDVTVSLPPRQRPPTFLARPTIKVVRLDRLGNPVEPPLPQRRTRRDH